MRTVILLLSAMSLGAAGCALRDGNGDLVFPNLGKSNEPAAEPAPPSTAPTEAKSEQPAPATVATGVDPHPEAEDQRRQTVETLDRFLGDNYLPGMGSHVEYGGTCVIRSGGDDVSLMHLNRKFLGNVEWIDPPLGNRFYKITVADNSRMVAFTVKVSSEGAAQQVVSVLEALATTCGS